jgi:hypothetical protein
MIIIIIIIIIINDHHHHHHHHYALMQTPLLANLWYSGLSGRPSLHMISHPNSLIKCLLFTKLYKAVGLCNCLEVPPQ